MMDRESLKSVDLGGSYTGMGYELVDLGQITSVIRFCHLDN